MAVGIPTAIAGAVALALSASPAYADERAAAAVGADERAFRALPATPAANAISIPAVTVSAIKPAAATPTTYTVVPGDTISAIASRHGSTTNAVLTANGLSTSSIIYPGQTIQIPGATTTPQPSTPTTSTSTSTSTSNSSTSASYEIKAGDTISAIASRHGSTTNAILTANGLSTSSIIYPGQTIQIPAKASAISATPAASTSTSSSAAASSLDAEQTANAKLIIQVGRELGVSDRGIAIALGTAMQESWIRNLDWGDRDSLGLFQQRPSTGWGTADQVRDPVRSIKTFFGGPSDPNGYDTRGLLDIPGWQSMTFAEAAQAVQISAYPDRYAQWEAPAYAWLASLG
ncbi:LysM peptidoglycan-binding domain-containing protein [Microbacterium marmarense]|uniref:LysM peptidoglycan-binding domain-containing protein n=1 Tax=Microbacterium marmarense TaxID=3122051 RepID=A0ABU8LU22_9MICO